MRQRRDGETEIVDSAPHIDQPGLRALLARPRWRVGLVWYMRTLSGVWIAKGLFNWFVVLGFSSNFGDFVMLPRALQASIVFFAAADLTAAISLWLAAPWGGALWLLCAACEATTPVDGIAWQLYQWLRRRAESGADRGLSDAELARRARPGIGFPKTSLIFSGLAGFCPGEFASRCVTWFPRN